MNYTKKEMSYRKFMWYKFGLCVLFFFKKPVNIKFVFSFLRIQMWDVCDYFQRDQDSRERDTPESIFKVVLNYSCSMKDNYFFLIVVRNFYEHEIIFKVIQTHNLSLVKRDEST